FQHESDALDQADSLHALWRARVQAADAATQTAGRTYLLLRNSVVAQYGSDAATLNDFGMQPPKKGGAKTVETKVAAAAKAKATRAARHTMGSRQKQGIKGNVVAVEVTPVTTSPPAVPAPASIPAMSTSPSPPKPAPPA
ncbi:MAG: hypothetical protein FWD17_20030, partial [Polyangiaceae bacterium]|nr:hypothetical protein [Polyangiaceae bacterium]